MNTHQHLAVQALSRMKTSRIQQFRDICDPAKMLEPIGKDGPTHQNIIDDLVRVTEVRFDAAIAWVESIT